MDTSDLGRVETKRVLFVWDGTDDFVQIADRLVRTLDSVAIYAVHAMPHEAINAYSTVGNSVGRASQLERSLKLKFAKAARRTSHLRFAKLELVFGDRIREITSFGEVIKADLILAPAFQQSSFSKWIHGDLNERIQSKARCPVVILTSNLAVDIEVPVPHAADSAH